ncbi:hypothetical protein [Streptomyces sp. H39-S7]|uniref:hypothetical protein n=1 Tax=Streptomyces sp. H39-S7 TaxID=3004357 RepID=UPI0022B077FB|nr:hypothetical protein [Streptomyces sp. H39-S7]MCZ4123289.1 hypothetical protein [Streptomyces sp. H39-S7]
MKRLPAFLLASLGALALLAPTAGQALAAGSGTAGPPPSVWYSADDLGTLGGTTSSASALDGDTVVGTSQLAGDATRHAFAYQLHSHTMTDLGTLGTSSQAVDVQGAYVVGTSALSDGGPVHAFAYSLPKHRMADIGTLGGSSADVAGISGRTVVGSSSLPGDTVAHAYAYDLNTRTMTDLGSLAGPAGSSSATAISGSIVVGTSTVPGAPGAARHGYAYDLTTRTMTDLGTLGGTYSTAHAVSGHTVVGQSRTAGDSDVHGYAYDLGTGIRTDLGPDLKIGQIVGGRTAAGSDSLVAFTFDLVTHTIVTIPGRGVTEVNAMTGNLLVGNIFAVNSFAYIYDVRTAVRTDLPSLGGLNSHAVQLNRAGVVVGSAALPPPDSHTANGPYHATVWRPHTG